MSNLREASEKARLLWDAVCEYREAEERQWQHPPGTVESGEAFVAAAVSAVEAKGLLCELAIMLDEANLSNLEACRFALAMCP